MDAKLSSLSNDISELKDLSLTLKEIFISLEADYNIASDRYDEIADELSSQRQHMYNLKKVKEDSVFSPRELSEIDNDPCRDSIAALEDKIRVAEKEYKDLRYRKEKIQSGIDLVNSILDRTIEESKSLKAAMEESSSLNSADSKPDADGSTDKDSSGIIKYDSFGSLFDTSPDSVIAKASASENSDSKLSGSTDSKESTDSISVSSDSCSDKVQSSNDAKSDFVFTSGNKTKLNHLSHSCKEISKYVVADPFRAQKEILNVGRKIEELIP